MTELEQLRKFVEWERTHNPDPSGRKHVAEWAADEIKRLREALDAAEADAARYRWLRDEGYAREVCGTASMRPGRGPFVAFVYPSISIRAEVILSGQVADDMIDHAIKARDGQGAAG